MLWVGREASATVQPRMMSVRVKTKVNFFQVVQAFTEAFNSEGVVNLVTSTPFVRKSAATKGRREVEVHVYDGLVMRSLTIPTSDSLFELLEKISTAVKGSNNSLELGHED